MFDEAKALSLLEEDRKKYVKNCLEYVKGLMDMDMDDLASYAIIQAGQNLQRLEGSILYVQQMSGGYPRFNTVVE